MNYQPWKPWNPWGLSDGERAAQAVGMGVFLVLGMAVYGWHSCVKSKHADDKVNVTQSEKTTPQHQVWQTEDKRGLFNLEYDFITAKSAADSAYAEDERLDLGQFDAQKNELTVWGHRSKGSGWGEPETMKYVIQH